MASVRIDRAGAPLFIAEIASELTKGNDQGEKKQAYAAIGVAEYVVVDPDGALLPEPFIAWRLRDGMYVPWEQETDGWWYSTVLEVTFQPGRPFLRVRDRDGVELAPSGVVRQRTRDLERQTQELEHHAHESGRRLAAAEQQQAALEELVRRYRDRTGTLGCGSIEERERTVFWSFSPQERIGLRYGDLHLGVAGVPLASDQSFPLLDRP